MGWIDESSTHNMLRAAARKTHIALLRTALADGQIDCTTLGGKPATRQFVPHARVSVEDFCDYAATFQVRVIIRKGKDAKPWKEICGMQWIEIAIRLANQIQQQNPSLSGTEIAVMVRTAMMRDRVTGRAGNVPTAATINRKALKGVRPRLSRNSFSKTK